LVYVCAPFKRFRIEPLERAKVGWRAFKRGRASILPPRRLFFPEISDISPSPRRMTDPQKPETLNMPPTPSTESALAELTRASNRLESTMAFLQQRTSHPPEGLRMLVRAGSL